MAIFWLSFVDTDKPRGSRFAGACLVRAASYPAAMSEAWRQECNPGGEVQGIEVPAQLEGCVLDAELNILYTTHEECEAVNEAMQRRAAEILKEPVVH